MTIPRVEMPPEVLAAYTKYVVDHHGELDPPDLACVMFNAGARIAITGMVQFGDIIPQLHRIEDRVKGLLKLMEGFTE